MTTAPLVISVGRGALRESTHRVHAVVCRADGSVVRSWGNPDRLTLLRSVAKPFQAVPLVEDGVTTRFAITEAELALTCASHNSEDVHIAAARSILRKVGVDEAALVCGAHPPLLPDRAAELREMGLEGAAVTSNCSGKHAGMLALAVHHGWPTREYEQPAHPVQLRMVEEVARWTGLAKSDLRLETDGCGVPCFGVPLNSLARGAARFAQAVSEGQEGPRAVAAAMTGHPFMVAGSGRLCTALMATAEGGLFAKVGAEGVYAAGSPEVGMGVALKVEDGAWRAAPPALLAVLRVVGLLGETQWEALEDYHSPWVVNTVGDPVGRISADI
ncbi:MAG: asparaginase [Gemmatimonadota bacterium]|nr:asparaginase [Gemmatimonadota bacterium]